MENPADKVTINNPADIIIIVGYFIMVISVGIWVSACVPDFNMFPVCGDKSRNSVTRQSLCFSQCFGSIVGRLEDISWQDGQ